MSFAQAFKENPIPFFFAFLLVVGGTALAAAGIFVRTRGVLLGAMGVVAAVLCMAYEAAARSKLLSAMATLLALPDLPAADRARVQVQMEDNASWFVIAGAFAIVPLLLGVVSIARAKKAEPASP
ncbi:MAG TPA: hypothetical protein VF407_11635 [Polyangiaceae bacterium]